MRDIDINELRALVREIIKEDMANFKPALTPQAHAMLNTGSSKNQPPPLPAGAQNQKPASASLPQKNALNKFKADVNMAVDAAQKVSAAVGQANTKEALRWLDKVIQYASSAKNVLGVK